MLGSNTFSNEHHETPSSLHSCPLFCTFHFLQSHILAYGINNIHLNNNAMVLFTRIWQLALLLKYQHDSLFPYSSLMRCIYSFSITCVHRMDIWLPPFLWASSNVLNMSLIQLCLSWSLMMDPHFGLYHFHLPLWIPNLHGGHNILIIYTHWLSEKMNVWDYVDWIH